MFCTNCGKAVEPDTRFCPHCGTQQAAETPPPQPPPPAASRAPVAAASPPVMAAPVQASAGPSRGGKPALWAGVGALVLAAVGGAGYWGWSNKVAGDEAAQKLVLEEAARKLADEEQRRLAAEKIADAAEITAAQAMLDKHIAAEEAEAQARAQAAPAGQAPSKAATARR